MSFSFIAFFLLFTECTSLINISPASDLLKMNRAQHFHLYLRFTIARAKEELDYLRHSPIDLEFLPSKIEELVADELHHRLRLETIQLEQKIKWSHKKIRQYHY